MRKRAIGEQEEALWLGIHPAIRSRQHDLVVEVKPRIDWVSSDCCLSAMN